MTGPEYTDVEIPFLNQLATMGWKVVTGSVDHPSVTGRASFREVLIKDDLAKALRRINLRDGKPWLDESRIAQAIGALERIGHARLMEANQPATQLLLEGVTVEGLPGWDQGRDKTVRFIDWEHPDRNTFTAVSQFKVDCPGGMSKGSVRPDITLFINGIPVVVVECKNPTISEPLASAIDQLRRYHNARKDAGEVDEGEGAERLFTDRRISVKIWTDSTKCHIRFTDSGPGIAKSIATKVFEPLFSMKEGGRGMGLTIAKHIVDQHGGKICIDVDQRRRGANVHIELANKRSRSTLAY